MEAMTHAAATEQSSADAINDVFEIVPVHPEKVPMVWDTVEPWLLRAMEYGDGLYAVEDVLQAIQRQDFILWVAVADNDVVGMAICSIDAYPRKTLATVRWAGGRTNADKDWMRPMIATLKGWGRHFGASMLVGAGRKGWLRGFGFREVGVLFEQGIDA